MKIHKIGDSFPKFRYVENKLIIYIKKGKVKSKVRNFNNKKKKT